VQTNILIFDIAGTGMDTRTFSAKLKERGVIANGVNANLMRMVTHYDVTTAMCKDAVDAVRGAAFMPRGTSVPKKPEAGLKSCAG
jgi:threonine aldolase